MAYVHQLPSRSISKLWRSPGGIQTASNLLDRCSSSINASISLLPCEWTLNHVVCLRVWFCQHQLKLLNISADKVSLAMIQWMLAAMPLRSAMATIITIMMTMLRIMTLSMRMGCMSWTMSGLQKLQACPVFFFFVHSEILTSSCIVQHTSIPAHYARSHTMFSSPTFPSLLLISFIFSWLGMAQIWTLQHPSLTFLTCLYQSSIVL